MRALAVILALFTAPLALPAQQPRPSPSPGPPISRLQAAIDRIVRSSAATWAVYVKSLDTGEEIAIDADRPMDTMSTIKIPLMVEVLEQVRAGTLQLDERVTLLRDDFLPGTGILRSLEPGAVLTLKDLLTLMIIVSDNTATDLLYRRVGGTEAVNRRMEALGLKVTRATGTARAWFDALRAAPERDAFHREAKHPFGLSTAREMGQLLEKMERGTLVDKTSSDLMLDTLRAQVYRSRIPRFLAGYRVPHKTGDFLPYIADDVGVLEAPGRTVVLSVFTAQHYGSGEALEEAIGRVAEQVAAYFTYRQP
jgi:beta-lactamase class A